MVDKIAPPPTWPDPGAPAAVPVTDPAAPSSQSTGQSTAHCPSIQLAILSFTPHVPSFSL